MSLCLLCQVTRGMFGANRKNLYYTQQSMFPPHRPDKDVSQL
uniref:Uncharacterized protein n=1 Tax=Labrus bergylta TaxID=56723 RepID=A0A3Q3EUP1_9LABR